MEENLNTVEQEGAGIVKIAEDVVAVIAGIAASEVAGVAGMSNNLTSGIYDLLGKKNFSKGVKVDIDGGNVTVDLFVIVEYGAKIPDVSFKIQESVKKNVESMTGLNADKINIHIQGVKIDKDGKDEVDAEEETEE